MDWTEIWGIIDKGGVVALSGLIVFALVKGWLVPRYVVEDKDGQIAHERERGDRFETLAFRGANLSVEASKIAEEKQKEKIELQNMAVKLEAARKRGEIF